ISERGLFEAGFDNKANETNDRVFWFVCEWIERFPDSWRSTILATSDRHRMLIFRYVISQDRIAYKSTMKLKHDFPTKFKAPEWVLNSGPTMVRELLLSMFDPFPGDESYFDGGPAPLFCYCLNQLYAEWEAGFECMNLDDITAFTHELTTKLKNPPCDLSETILMPPNLAALSQSSCYDNRSWSVFWIDPNRIQPLIQDRLGRLGVDPEAPLLATLREALLDWQKKDKADDE
ncbi:MAG: hypothetical protein JNL58_32700, partial [Planctomyces sp.]|nr:hypothetical protein [Planctomyces sp.]